MPPADPANPPDEFPSSVLEMAELGTLFEARWPQVAIVRRRLDPSLGVRRDPEEVVSEHVHLSGHLARIEES